MFKEVGVDTRLHVECADGVLTLTFDRPDRLNAITSKTVVAVLEQLDRAAHDDTVAVVVFTGAGQAFTAGQDLQELATSFESADEGAAREALARFQAVTERVLALDKPTVAAVNGVAVGFGAELALACDIRLASTTARFGYVEATRGLFQTNGVLWLLPRVVGHGNAVRLLLTGEIVEAAEALRIGLVSSLHAPSEVLPAAVALARRLAANAPQSVRMVKDVLRATWDQPLGTVMAREVEGMLACLASRDLREGTAAFLEHRAPHYTGR